MKKTVFLVLLLCTLPAQAQELMSKPLWGNDIVVGVSPILCKPDQYFMACFTTDVKRCTNTVEKVAEGCLNALDKDIPDMLNPAEQNKWATAVGQCITKSYAAEMAAAGKPCDVAAQSGSVTAKSLWTGEVVNAMPPALCQPTQYLMKCFNIDAGQCSETIRTISQNCLASIEKDIPEALNETEKNKWAKVLGACIGKTYVSQMTSAGKKKSGPGC